MNLFDYVDNCHTSKHLQKVSFRRYRDIRCFKHGINLERKML